MRKLYNPLDWYWRADDGRIYSSGRQVAVSEDDQVFIAWMEDGTQPTPWPVDTAGVQSEDALQSVLEPYGLFVGLSAYAAARRYIVETGGIAVDGTQIATDRVSQAMIGNAYAYVQTSGSGSVQFKTAAGFVNLTSDQIKTLAIAVGQHVQKCFAVEAQIATELAATSPTITTRAQVDSLFAAIND